MKKILCFLSVFAMLLIFGTVAHAASAAPVQTLVIAGANGTAGATDPHTEFSMDNGQTWHQAYLYGSHPWGFVPGTNSWLNCAPDGQSPLCLNRSVLYRISFQVPSDATNANMQFEVKADNYASISLNGKHVADITGQNSPSVDASLASAIQPGLNQILMNVTDTGGWAGLNYKITITMNAAVAPVIVDSNPTATVSYSTTALTNGDVVATIQPSKPVTVTNNGGSTSYIFTQNGSFTFQFVDLAGNAGTATATVSNIDKVAPVTTDNAPAGWQARDIVVALNASDVGSGVASTYYAVDKGPTQTGNTVSITSEGTHSITYWSVDRAGNIEAAKTVLVQIDKTAPTTSDNAPANWVNHDVSVTLTATDSGSGVAATYYTVDGGAQQTGTNVTVTGEGIHTINYWSVDAAGNTEKQHNVTVKIDKTAPTLAVTANGTPLTNGMEFQDSQLITLALQATDNLSGVAEQSITVDGKSYVAGTALDWAGQLGIHAVQITAKDTAGNVSQSTINVTLKTSISAMEQLIERYSASGDLKGSLKKQLLEALKDAQESLKEGDFKDATGAMKEFLKKISKTNKESSISDHAKAVLVADANALIQTWSVNVSDRDHNNKSDELNNKDDNQRNGDKASR